MPASRLPPHNLTYLKRQAKKLLIAFNEREQEALSRVHERLPSQRMPRRIDAGTGPDRFGLRDALLVIAREHGFRSWQRLVEDEGDPTEATDVPSEGIPPMIKRLPRTALPGVDMPVMNKDSRSTLVCSLRALLPALGQAGWSIPRLEALTGYAFYFEMRPGGASVFDDNLDWGLAMHCLGTLGQVETFDANKNMANVDLPGLKAEARDAVVASLGRDIPSLVWAPLSVEQKGKIQFSCWGLIVGYDSTDEAYLIRQPAEELDYPVRYDAIGHADPVEWFHIGLFRPRDLEDHDLHLASLRSAIAWADGSRWEKSKNPIGFAAYELWLKAFEADVETAPTLHHAETLKQRRGAAADYMRELAETYPDAADPLAAAAAHYDREASSITTIHEVCTEAGNFESGSFTEPQRARIRDTITEVLEAERAAIGAIEDALGIVDGGA